MLTEIYILFIVDLISATVLSLATRYQLWCVVVCDLENLKNEEAMARVRPWRHKKKCFSLCLYCSINAPDTSTIHTVCIRIPNSLHQNSTECTNINATYFFGLFVFPFHGQMSWGRREGDRTSSGRRY